MIKSDADTVLIKLTKETIEDFIVLIETRQYDGKLFKKDIKYHLIQINTKKTKADCKELAT